VDISEALARIEIQHVLWTYARGTDRADYETMSSVYHPDGTDRHVSFDGLGTDFVRQSIDRKKGTTTVGQHHITNVVIEMRGANDALSESYFLAFHPHPDSEGGQIGIVAGRYLDHFQRREGVWKILARRVVMDWTREEVPGLPWTGIDGKPEQGGRIWDKDPSYAFFAGDD
jgi:hypothetical protein